MSKIETLKTTLANLESEWAAERDAIKTLRTVDAIDNECGEGYNNHEAAAERLAYKYLPQITALKAEIFAAEWTPEVLTARRASWNAEIAKLGRNANPRTVAALTERLGYGKAELGRAKALHGIK